MQEPSREEARKDTEKKERRHTPGQDTYRQACHAFFAKDAHYERLEKIVYHGEQVFSLVAHFVTRYSLGRVFKVKRKGVEVVDSPHAGYLSALRAHRKLFYDFESRHGRGVLWTNGIQNPNVPARAGEGSIALPLPLLTALRWLINHDFDRMFWNHLDKIKVSYEAETAARKSGYMRSHKRKKREIRSEVTAEFLRRKAATAGVSQQQQQQDGTHFTRAERKEIGVLIEAEKKRRKEEAQRKRGRRSRESSGKPPKKEFKTGITDMDTDATDRLTIGFN